MEKHFVVENEKFAYRAMQYLDSKEKKLTRKMVYENNYSGDVIQAEVVFCPECKKMHYTINTYFKDGEFVYPADKISPVKVRDKLDYYGVIDCKYDKLVCPDCGANISDYKSANLLKTSVNRNGSNLIRSIHRFNPEDDKLVLSIFVSYFYPNTFAEKLVVIPVIYRLVFNYKDGMTYFLQGRTIDNKHPKFDNTPEIFNATLGASQSCDEIMMITKSQDLIREAAEALIEIHHGSKEQLTQKGDFTDTTFAMLTTYNNIPYFGYDFYKMANEEINHLRLWDRKPRDRFTYKLRTIKSKYLEGDANAYEKFLFKGVKQKAKKALRKEIFANPLLVGPYRLILKLGFKNEDIIRDFLGNGYDCMAGIYYDFENLTREQKEYVVSFMKKFIKLKGEVGVKRAFAIDYISTEQLKDTAYMFAIFEKKKMLKDEYLKGDIIKIHDKLARDYKKVRSDNKVITYKPEAYALNDTIDGFTFRLAKDTYELIDIGQEMHICVGSYGDSAAHNRCVIVVMQKGNKYVGCIELSPDCKRLIQAKACFNNMLEEKKAETLKLWVEKNKIDFRNCMDYRHIASGNISYDENTIYQGRYDYANYYANNVEYDARHIFQEDAEEDELFF